ncbi:MAG: G5 domain-containing protein [Patescibacteria group bacterium]|nr:G5 domain-containing protein [Patescibacteria group bacterium]
MIPLQKGRYLQKTAFIIVIAIAVFFSTTVLTKYAFSKEMTSLSEGYEYQTTALEVLPPMPKPEPLLQPQKLSITQNSETKVFITYSAILEQALNELEIPLTENSITSLPLDFVLLDETEVTIDEVEIVQRFETEVIGFTSITVTDDNREIDTTTIVQTGRNGEKKLTYDLVYKNGILQSKTLVNEEIISQPQNEIVAIGTKKVFREATVGGYTFQYWRKMTVFATSYDANCDGCNNITATGAILVKGVIAVDPRVIPLGTRMFVPGYGLGTALDVGGAIKGKKIDLGFPDLALVQGQWSARFVEIYILE